MMRLKEDERSMKKKLAARRKEIEAKLDELHVTDGLRRLIGAFPFMTDGEMEAAKDGYLKEKYSSESVEYIVILSLRLHCNFISLAGFP